MNYVIMFSGKENVRSSFNLVVTLEQLNALRSLQSFMESGVCKDDCRRVPMTINLANKYYARWSSSPQELYVFKWGMQCRNNLTPRITDTFTINWHQVNRPEFVMPEDEFLKLYYPPEQETPPEE